MHRLLVNMDVIMLGHFKPLAAVGIYGLAARLSLLIAVPLEAIPRVKFQPAAGHQKRSRHPAWSQADNALAGRKSFLQQIGVRHSLTIFPPRNGFNHRRSTNVSVSLRSGCAGVHHRLRGPFAAKHHQKIADHGGAPVAVEVDDVMLLQPGQSHLVD